MGVCCLARKFGQAGTSPRQLRAAGLAGQAIPLDFAAGLFIFVLVLAYFLIQWDLFATRFAELATAGSMDSRAIDISEMLVHSPGQPENWTSEPLNAQSIGFARKQNLLDWNRVAAFSSLPYANAKQLLGTDHEFLVIIETPDGARYATIGHDENSTRAVEVVRMAILNETVVKVRVRLYE